MESIDNIANEIESKKEKPKTDLEILQDEFKTISETFADFEAKCAEMLTKQTENKQEEKPETHETEE